MRTPALFVACALVLAAALPAPRAHAADKPPNILHIVVDDLGWKDVGFNGCCSTSRRTASSAARSWARTPAT